MANEFRLKGNPNEQRFPSKYLTEIFIVLQQNEGNSNKSKEPEGGQNDAKVQKDKVEKLLPEDLLKSNLLSCNKLSVHEISYP